MNTKLHKVQPKCRDENVNVNIERTERKYCSGRFSFSSTIYPGPHVHTPSNLLLALFNYHVGHASDRLIPDLGFSSILILCCS